MDLHPDTDQLEIISSAQDYLTRELPAERTPKQAGTKLADREWRGLAEMGWFGLGIPEDAGGVGLSVVEEALVVREFGRELLPPSAFAVMLAAHAAAESGDTELVHSLIAGAHRVGFAVPTAGLDDGPYRLVDMDGADLVIGWDADTFILAELGAFDGVEDAGSVDATVQMKTAKSLSANKVRRIGRAASTLPLRATLLNAAMMVGDAEGMSSRAVEYAKVRVQFGRPIGGFQAISHRLAKTAARCEAAVAILQYAAVRLRDGFDQPELHVAAARLVASDAARENAATSMQVFGGYGQTYEYLPHLFLKRALILSALGGGGPADEAAVLGAKSTL